MKFLRIAGSIVLFLLSGGLVAAKKIVDWVGRSTFVEDAEALGPKVAKMFEWLADQPALAFYAVPGLLALVGVGLLVAPYARTPHPARRRSDRAAPPRA
jgi:hypothetical protein